MAKIEIKNTEFQVHKEGEALLMNGELAAYDVIKLPDNTYSMVLNGNSYEVQVVRKNTATGELTLQINARTIQTKLHNKLAELLKSMGMESGKKKMKELKAPMPGLVLSVGVKAGDEVHEGQELLVLEAMKMENAIKSPQDGVIGSVFIQNQDKVGKNQVLITFQ
jgi:biotin carboxyl carrier protein